MLLSELLKTLIEKIKVVRIPKIFQIFILFAVLIFVLAGGIKIWGFEFLLVSGIFWSALIVTVIHDTSQNRSILSTILFPIYVLFVVMGLQYLPTLSMVLLSLCGGICWLLGLGTLCFIPTHNANWWIGEYWSEYRDKHLSEQIEKYERKLEKYKEKLKWKPSWERPAR